MTNNTLTTVQGIRVGHVTDSEGITGCTVILCPPETIGGVDQRGGAPGTRETDLLRPMHLVQHVNAVVLSGGSAFGLATADGVMRYLREQGIGFPTASGIAVPIVPAAILYDLEVGDANAHPTADMGYQAAAAAASNPVQQGSIGAGTGCTVGKIAGMTHATRAGIGSAVLSAGELIVASLFAVNCVGDVVDEDGSRIAGLQSGTSTLEAMKSMQTQPPAGNTVIGIVATNAALTKEAANKVAQMAHDGLARAVRPAHTMYDGDTIFSLATGQVEADINLVGALAAEVTAAAIRAGARFINES